MIKVSTHWTLSIKWRSSAKSCTREWGRATSVLDFSSTRRFPKTATAQRPLPASVAHLRGPRPPWHLQWKNLKVFALSGHRSTPLFLTNRVHEDGDGIDPSHRSLLFFFREEKWRRSIEASCGPVWHQAFFQGGYPILLWLRLAFGQASQAVQATDRRVATLSKRVAWLERVPFDLPDSRQKAARQWAGSPAGPVGLLLSVSFSLSYLRSSRPTRPTRRRLALPSGLRLLHRLARPSRSGRAGALWLYFKVIPSWNENWSPNCQCQLPFAV